MEKNLFGRRLLALVLCFGLLLSMFAGVVAFGEEGDDGENVTSSVSSEIEAEEEAASQPEDGGVEDDPSSQLEDDVSSQPEDDLEDGVSSQPDDDPDEGVMPAVEGYTYAATGWWYAGLLPEMKSSTATIFIDDGTTPEAWLEDLMSKNPVAQMYFFDDAPHVPTGGWHNFTLTPWEKAEPFESESDFDGWVKCTYTATVTEIDGTDFEPGDTLTIADHDASIFALDLLLPEDPNNIPKQPRYGVTAWNFNGAGGYLTDTLASYGLKLSEQEKFHPEKPEDFADELNAVELYQTIKVWRRENDNLPSIGQYGDWYNIPVEWVYDGPMEGDYFDGYAYRAETAYQFYWDANGEPTDFYILVVSDYKNPLDKEVLDKHIVSPQEPAELKIDLFDYWVDDTDHLKEGTYGEITAKGINAGHHLKFHDGYLWAGSDVFGAWNLNFELNETGGIVAPRLGKDGYPVLQLDTLEPYKSQRKLPSVYSEGDTIDAGATVEKLTESLAYLFDPEKSHPGKASYKDVNGLLTLDEEGNYAFSARKNYAYYDVSQGDGGDFTLYDTWGIVAAGESPNGQFFPFKDPLESPGYPYTGVFVGEENGALVQAPKPEENQGIGFDSVSPSVNHWMGLTMETAFVQPIGGRLNTTTPMTFTFRGDDDIWVFVDDVLVIDLSGIHSTLGSKIDFSTGEVVTFPVDGAGNDQARYEGARGTTTLRKLFEDVLGDEFDEDDWSGDTFATYTQHTLKLFFMERGGVDSNFALTYNLMQPHADRVRKVDENGKPLSGVEFEVYTAYEQADGTFAEGEYITSTTTDETGHGEFLNDKKLPISFSELAAEKNTNYFLLREMNTPAGYRANPDLILKLHETTRTFTVVNKWQSGAYGSFTAYFTQGGTSGLETEDGYHIPQEDLLDGLILVVPCLTPKEGGLLPMYGSNTVGWEVVQTDKVGVPSAIVEAAVKHMRSGPTIQDYYLNWVTGDHRLKGTLNNLPGDPTRYAQNGGGEAVGKYLFLSKAALSHFDNLGFDVGGQANADDRYAELKRAVNTQEGFAAIMSLINQPDQYAHDLALLSSAQFDRDYRSVIYVPNEQRRLQVRKVDNQGNPVEGAVFAIFNTAKQAAEYEPTATTAEGVINELKAAMENNSAVGLKGVGQTKILDGENATLTFEENGDTNPDDGIAHIDWPDRQYVGEDDFGNPIPDTDDSVFWMRELYAPSSYEVNPYLIRIAGGDQAIYAHATGFKFDGEKGVLLTGSDAANDRIRVQSGLGTLAQTLVKYAASDYVDVTLRDITIYKQRQKEQTEVLGAWEDDPDAPEYNLHYGRNNEGLTGQYGLHDEQYKEGQVPVYIVDDGYVRVMPRQNTHFDGYIPADGSFTDLTGVDLNALFGLLNIVIVEDPVHAPAIEIEKWEAVTDTTAANGTELTAPQQQEALEVGSGDTVTYYFKISNNGDFVAEGTTFSDELPVANGLQLQFVNGSARKYQDPWNEDTAASLTATAANGVVTVDLGDLEPEKAVYIAFDVKIPTEQDGSPISRTLAWVNEAETAFAVNRKAGYWITADIAYQKKLDELAKKYPAGASGADYEAELKALQEQYDPAVIYGPKNSNHVSLVTGPVGALSVSKTVSGRGADQTQNFTFTVTLTGEGVENVNGEYDGVEFSEGVGVFTLHHGQSKTFENLPAGLSYTVTETRDKDYTISRTGDTGIIQVNQTSVAAFVNKKKVKSVEDEDDEDDEFDEDDEDGEGDEDDEDGEDNEDGEGDPTQTPEPTPRPDPDHPQTGDPGNLGLWVSLAVGSGTGLAATGFLPKRRKKYRHLKSKYRHMK